MEYTKAKTVFFTMMLKQWDIHMQKLAALFITVKTSKQPWRLAVGGWVDKLWYIQTVKYHSVLKGNKLSSLKKTWGKLKCILLSEISQSEKVTDCMLPIIWHSGKDINKETRKRSVVARDGRDCGREGGWIGRSQRIFTAVKILCILQWWIYGIIHLSKPIECTTPRVNPKVTMHLGWLWCANVGSSFVKNVLFWWVLLILGEGICVQVEDTWEISVPSSQFCCKP